MPIRYMTPNIEVHVTVDVHTGHDLVEIRSRGLFEPYRTTGDVIDHMRVELALIPQLIELLQACQHDWAPFEKENTMTEKPYDNTPVTEPGEKILKYFEFAHLPPKLQDVSRKFHELATFISTEIPGSAERTVALRKLLESKDAAVRAKLP